MQTFGKIAVIAGFRCGCAATLELVMNLINSIPSKPPRACEGALP
jgi:histidinol-phosphate/aromatic aminotransferase/cobyric acid decarboxylase-like protein